MMQMFGKVLGSFQDGEPGATRGAAAAVGRDSMRSSVAGGGNAVAGSMISSIHELLDTDRDGFLNVRPSCRRLFGPLFTITKGY